jgi:hypothetical protein
MFWLIVLAVVVVLAAVSWWSSGRQRRGINDADVQKLRKKSDGSTGNYGGTAGGI